MKTFLLVACVAVVAGACTGRAPSPGASAARPDASERGTVIVSPHGALVQWGDGAATVLIPLPGREVRRANLVASRPDVMALVMDGVLIQILDVDPRVVTGGAEPSGDLLAQHRQWEAKHWNRVIGAAVEPRSVPAPQTALGDVALWELRWPEDVRRARNVLTVSQVYLTFVAGGRIVTISSPVMEGESVDDRFAYLRSLATEIRVRQGALTEEGLRGWLQVYRWKTAP